MHRNSPLFSSVFVLLINYSDTAEFRYFNPIRTDKTGASFSARAGV